MKLFIKGYFHDPVKESEVKVLNDKKELMYTVKRKRDNNIYYSIVDVDGIEVASGVQKSRILYETFQMNFYDHKYIKMESIPLELVAVKGSVDWIIDGDVAPAGNYFNIYEKSVYEMGNRATRVCEINRISLGWEIILGTQENYLIVIAVALFIDYFCHSNYYNYKGSFLNRFL